MDLAYMGFTQEAGVRCFRFECQIGSLRPLAAPRRTVQFVVLADMPLFVRYGTPIQDGPAICRGILAEAQPESTKVKSSRLLLRPGCAHGRICRPCHAGAEKIGPPPQTPDPIRVTPDHRSRCRRTDSL